MKRQDKPWESSPVRGWMWKRFPRMVMWAKDSWVPFGLSMDTVSPNPPHVPHRNQHDLVADYLKRHVGVRARYEADQTGSVKYYDVLTMAEQEMA